MTYEEAKNVLKKGADKFDIDLIRAYGRAIEAIEKQIPKKVVREAGKILYSCPNNRLHQMTVDNRNKFMFCPICGQALDWSDAE